MVGCTCVFGYIETPQQYRRDIEILWSDDNTFGIFSSEPGTLHRAVEANLYCIAQDMITAHLNYDNVQDYVNARDCWDCTHLFYAAEQGHVETAHLLLDNGTDPNVANDQINGGTSALVMAIQEGHPKVAKLLLEYGANPNGCPEGELLHPLDVAKSVNDTETLTLLLAYGAVQNR